MDERGSLGVSRGFFALGRRENDVSECGNICWKDGKGTVNLVELCRTCQLWVGAGGKMEG